MPGDFVNAYILGSVGETAGIIGACATFLYNVKRAIDDIRSGNKRVVIVGNSEAPVVPHVIEGYRVMGALAEDEELKALDDSDICDNELQAIFFECGIHLRRSIHLAGVNG